ncbi:potassium channel family protein [Rhodobacter sp. Har01]|uniref:ion channel n=1 Tax=Rhodobacter sp. Har01 TaxID=2883999 RepID=UPI001D08A2A5|nr:ion channel [Rhodobacter sp. Har01]MCB6179546.1 potassium channel family protein [Rhodobacter sp. Har01]
MLIQIALGSVLLVLNIAIAATAAFVLEEIFVRWHRWLIRPPQRPKLLLLIAGTAVFALAIITAGVWVWALAYDLIGAFPTLETSVYFSLVCFTTLGFGDVILPLEWRVLAGMEAANGFMHIGLLTALMIETLRQVRMAQIEHDRRSRTGPRSD